MSILDQVKSNPALPLPALDIYESVQAYGRQIGMFEVLSRGDAKEIANSLGQFGQTGVIIEGDYDPYFTPNEYNDVFADSTVDVSFSKLCELIESLSDEDLKTAITPLWIYLRTRIVTQYDGDSLVDQRTGSEINSENVRPVKTETLSEKAVGQIFSNSLSFIDKDGNSTFEGWELTSSRVILTPEGGIINDPFAGFWINPGDPYRDGAPSPRAIAMKIVDELDETSRLNHMSILLYAMTGIQAHPQGDSLVLEGGSMNGFHLWPVEK